MEGSGRKKCMTQGGMGEAPENGKVSPHSVHANGLIDNVNNGYLIIWGCFKQ